MKVFELSNAGGALGDFIGIASGAAGRRNRQYLRRQSAVLGQAPGHGQEFIGSVFSHGGDLSILM